MLKYCIMSKKNNKKIILIKIYDFFYFFFPIFLNHYLMNSKFSNLIKKIVDVEIKEN